MWATAEVLLSLQPYVSSWYPQINMFAKQQNREPAKQYVSKTTKQCVNTTAKQQNRDFSQSVLQSVSDFSQSVLQSVSTSVSQTSVSQTSVSQYFSQSVLQSVLNSVSTDVNQSVGLFE